MAEIRPIKPSCEMVLPGHTVHWIQGKKSGEPRQPVVPMSLVVHDDGLVDIEGNDPKLTLWNHSPGLLRSTLNGRSGSAVWQPRFHVRVVPGQSGRVFNMARRDEQTPCGQRVRPRKAICRRVHSASMREDGDMIPGSAPVPSDKAKSGDDGT